jgi:hypothetical protein
MTIRPMGSCALLVLLLLAGCAQGGEPSAGTEAPTPPATASTRASTAPATPPIPPAAGPACDPCGVPTAPERAGEPSAALDATGSLLAVAAMEGNALFVQGVGQVPVQSPGWAYISVRHSEDGGRTWARAVLPYATTAAPGSAWGRYCVLADPVLERVGDELRLYGLGWPCTQGVAPHLSTVGSIWMARSRDNGATWGEPAVVVESPGAAEWPDKEWAATDPADPDRILVAWLGLQNPGTAWPLRAAHSLDGGATWSEPTTVTDPAQEGGRSVYSAMPAWTPDGQVHIAYRGCSGACVKVASSTDLVSWEAVEVAKVQPVQREGGQAIWPWHPSLAADPATGRLAVAWHSEEGGRSVAWVAVRADGAWGEPVRIPGLAGHQQDQWWPFVAYGNGTLHGFLYDRSEDPENLRTRPVAWRLDAGGPLVAAAGPAWNVTGNAYPFYGDYVGAAGSPGGVLLAWGQLDEATGFRHVHAARVR